MARNSNLVEKTMELTDYCRHLRREVARVHRGGSAESALYREQVFW